jgi:hypothetical protein
VHERAWLGPEAVAVLGEHLARSVAGWMALAGTGTTLSTDRDSAATRVEGPTGPLLVKWRRPAGRKAWKTVLRPSRERTEAQGLLLARACGIDVPSPLLILERRSAFGRLLGSVLVRPFVPGLSPADALLANSDGRRRLAPLARAVRGWHDAGYRHGDCWPKNLLLSEDGRRCLPIGAPKARRVAAGASLDPLRLRDLARLAAGARFLWPSEDPFAFLDPYLETPGLPPRPRVESAVAPLLARVLAKRAEDERTRPAREPHGPPLPVPLPPDARPIARQSTHLGVGSE